MTTKKMALVLVVIILAIGLAGCAMGNKGTVYYNRTTTIGKELLDLKEAKDKGAISEQEYNKVKKDLMKCGSIKFESSSGKEEK